MIRAEIAWRFMRLGAGACRRLHLELDVAVVRQAKPTPRSAPPSLAPVMGSARSARRRRRECGRLAPALSARTAIDSESPNCQGYVHEQRLVRALLEAVSRERMKRRGRPRTTAWSERLSATAPREWRTERASATPRAQAAFDDASGASLDRRWRWIRDTRHAALPPARWKASSATRCTV